MTSLKTQAINIALTGNWNKAISLNKEILEDNPNDIDTLNRLAFAYTILGKVKEAKKTYQKVLSIDGENPIANKNLKKLGPAKIKPSLYISTNMFLEESGKTKIVSLINTAQQNVIRNLQMGQLLSLHIKRSKIFVLGLEKQYIGMLPDDIGRRLIKFLNGGNIYESYVKLAQDHEVIIFIKEVKRSARFKNQPSFLFGDKTKFSLTSKNYLKSSGDLEEGE